jgi:hypothetical protein
MKNLFIQSSVLPEENKDRDIETREKKHTHTTQMEFFLRTKH